MNSLTSVSSLQTPTLVQRSQLRRSRVPGVSKERALLVRRGDLSTGSSSPVLGCRRRRSAPAVASLLSCHGGSFLSREEKAELDKVAEAIAQPGKGITACDEGPGTIGARFEAVGIENTEENRRAYRQMLFETPDCNKYLSAAILDPETVYQKSTTDGLSFPEKLSSLGIVPGVKPHLKVYALPGQSGSTVMQGLDSLAARCREYKAAGCKFAKWRSPLTIDVAAGQPSDLVIEANMQDLARYALICQDEGLVPIIEPDISLKGTHDLETAVAINVKVQAMLYHACLNHGVYMEGTILKSNIVNPGKDCPVAYSVEEIAEANIATLKRCMPVAIRSANFLSGGQSLEDAAARLSAMNKAKGSFPVNLSFSWSAALQMPLFALCKGRGGLCLDEMSALYLEELKIASLAALGEYNPPSGQGDHVPPAVREAEAVAA
uniref:fructose-bisphosphate aldolase n=1 Tax=Tetraselmis sp. GSL018 TaxID=582737 RepID=A0A061R8B5_9CHLO|mmetsp:Transcript_30368/g.72254  ORF Transcript_30368/g.72254 Transcript_30368/m.72254 type:complete len:435 (+) Transcript_30368:120-1424(+)